MKLPASLSVARQSIRRRLIGVMLLLAALLLSALLSGLFLLGRFSSPAQELAETLELQMEFFETEVQEAAEETMVSGVLLSRTMSQLLETHLAAENLSFSDLNDNGAQLEQLQSAMIGPLKEILLQSDCSGAFVMLDATVNTVEAVRRPTCSGLYLQRNESMADQKTLLLYRGSADLGRAHEIMPHRKWRLEFQMDQWPAPVFETEKASPTLAEQCTVSRVFQLPGTWERAVLMTLPLQGSDGTVYGRCGFELSQSYFQIHMAQPTNLSHMTCVLAFTENPVLDTAESLSCGVAGGAYLAPTGELKAEKSGSGMTMLTGGTVPYAAQLRSGRLFANGTPCMLAVMTPKAALDRAATRNLLQSVLLVALLLFFTVSCCIFFSRRFLAPILRSLEQLRSREAGEAHSGFQEIDDLFGFLARKDREHEEAMLALEKEKQDAQSAYSLVRDKYETARSEIDRLATSRVREVDPEEYQLFLDGIQHLTPTEKLIFGYYLEGRTVKEILEIANIKESTLRYHNRNIYSKLGVKSLKQLLHYAALMQWQQEKPQ